MPEEPEHHEPEGEPSSDVREDIADLQLAVVELADAVDAMIEHDEDAASDEVDDALEALFAE